MSSETQMAALPVRQRGTLEIIDTAMKLYRRHFGVLMGWSALVAALIVLVSVVPFGALFVYPFIASSCACCIAAAVRGQKMSFGQVWEFTKPRYGALLLINLVSWLLLGAAMGVAFLVMALLTLAGAWALSSLNAPAIVSDYLGGFGIFVAFAAGSVVGTMLLAWIGLAPIVACLEDDKRSSQALGRAFELMKGSWGRVLALSILLNLAVVAAIGIVIGTLALFGAGIGALSDNPTNTALVLMGVFSAAFFGLFLLFWNPIQSLILAVLYLDLRVRKEALDLEWNSYASAPPVEPDAPEPAAPDAAQVANQLVGAPLEGGYLPASTASAAPSAATLAPLDAESSEVNTSVEAAPNVTGDAAPQRPPAPAPPDVVVAEPVVLIKPPSPAPANAFDFSSSFSAGSDVDATSRTETERAPDADNKAEDARGAA